MQSILIIVLVFGAILCTNSVLGAVFLLVSLFSFTQPRRLELNFEVLLHREILIIIYPNYP